jgi:hypothetical protein
MNANEFVARARQGQAAPLIYWLGHGGWLDGQAAAPSPGQPIDPAAALAGLKTERPAVHAAYVQGLAQAGLTLQALPHLACDCSGFVCWALGVARNGAVLPGGWINTDAIVADAAGPRRLFVPLARAVPGALLVHPRPGGANPAPGHVAIVVAVDRGGRPTRMLHCAPENYLRQPADGQPRSAIAETDTAHFDAVPTSSLVMWKAFA